MESRVESDLQRHLTAQAAEAEQLWKSGRLSAFHKLVQSMFKRKQAAVGSAGISSKDGKTTYRSVQEQLKRFQEHFAEVFSCDSISAEQQAEMEQLISNVEDAIRNRTNKQQQQGGQQQQQQEGQQQQRTAAAGNNTCSRRSRPTCQSSCNAD